MITQKVHNEVNLKIVTTETSNKQVKEYYNLLGLSIPASCKAQDIYQVGRLENVVLLFGLSTAEVSAYKGEVKENYILEKNIRQIY